MTLAARLAEGEVLGMRAEISHARRGSLRHKFRTHVDYVLLAPERFHPPQFMSHNRFNLIAFHDADHGGPRKSGSGALWAWEKLASVGIEPHAGRVLALLTQPQFLGFWFNPVSFWMVIDGNALIAVIAEVNNTFGQRHSYLLVSPEGAPISPLARLVSRKVFHVSPFQPVAGEYHFSFSLAPDRIAIRINQVDGLDGVDTAMSGALRPLSSRDIVMSALRRPGGAMRVVAQIYWHALQLKLKGAKYRKLPPPPETEITQ